MTQKSFTLVELLLVVVILSIATGVAIPNFRNAYHWYVFNQISSDLVALMRYAQAIAVSRHKLYRLEFDADFTQAQLMQGPDNVDAESPVFEPLQGRFGKIVRIPSDVKVSCPVSAVHFYPDGNIEKTAIELKRGERTVVISTQVQKGAVRLLEDAG